MATFRLERIPTAIVDNVVQVSEVYRVTRKTSESLALMALLLRFQEQTW